MAALRFGKVVGMAAIIDTREERIAVDWSVSVERPARTVVRSLRVRLPGARVKDSRARFGCEMRDARCAMRTSGARFSDFRSNFESKRLRPGAIRALHHSHRHVGQIGHHEVRGLQLRRRMGEAGRSAGQRGAGVDLGPDDRVRADQHALAALDAEVRLPDRDLEREIPKSVRRVSHYKCDTLRMSTTT